MTSDWLNKKADSISEFIEINNLPIGAREFITSAANLAIGSKPKRMGMDFTSDPSVIFTLIYLDGKSIYMECFFEADAEPAQCNVIVYENKNEVYAFAGTFEEGRAEFLKITEK